MALQDKNNSILISLITNFLLVLGKGITGLLANSNALVADAVHSLTDVSAFFINYQACKNCKMYDRIDKNKTNEKIKQKIANIETDSTFYTGVILFTIGMAICFHNFMILVLDKAEKPNFITFVVAIISLVVYGGLLKYLKKSGNNRVEDCVMASRNANWQNEMNLISGTVVVIGLAGAMLGFIFMDEFAAIVVGSIVLSMGLKLIIEVCENLRGISKNYFKFIIIGCIFVAIILTGISLSFQL